MSLNEPYFYFRDIDDVKTLLLEQTRLSRREPGCERFELYHSQSHPKVFILVERWSTPLWDSSAWIAPDSALGTTMHALFGYDAHPSALQLAFYVAVALIIFGGARLMQPNRTAP